MDRNSRRINMRSADPAAYDQIKVLTTTTAFSDVFRAIYATHTGAVTVSLAVTQITNGSPVSKTIVINIPNTGGSFLLPISGESVTATFGAGTVYALI
jgi:hypothetical protein